MLKRLLPFIIYNMKGTLIFIILMCWFAFLFFGYIQIIQKTMKTENYHDPTQSRKVIEENKQKNRALLEKQKRLIRLRQDRMRTNRF